MSKVAALRVTASVALLVLSLSVLAGCATDWQMDYGTPAAQFLSRDIAELGAPYLGRKTTIKGTVARVDTQDPKVVWVFLRGGIRCNFGAFKAMAESSPVGSQVFVDGFLRHCETGDIVINPALYRERSAPFSPKHSE